MMKNRKTDSFIKVRYGYNLIFIFIMLVIMSAFSKVCIDIAKENNDKIARDFNNYFHISENKIDMYQRISNTLFEDADIKKYVSEIDSGGNVYQYIVAGKKIKSYRDIFNDDNSKIVLSDLESEVCIRDGGSMDFRELCSELSLDKDEIEKIREKDKLYLIERENNMLTFIFRNQYYNQKRLYCFITTDMNFFLADSEIEIVETKNPTKVKDNLWNRKQIHIAESEYMDGFAYKYVVKSGNPSLAVFLLLFNIICILCILFSKKITEKILNITYMPIIETYLKSKDDKSDLVVWDESVRRLIYNNEMMERRLKEDKRIQKKMLLWTLLYAVDDYRSEEIKKHGLEKFDGLCRVILICCDNEAKYQFARDYFSESDFEKNLDKQLASKFNGELVTIGAGKYVYITDFCDKEDIKEKLIGILDFIEIYDFEASVFLGKIVNSLKEINLSLRDALECAEKKAAFPERSILFSEDIPHNELVYYYPIDTEVSLIENVLSGNKEKLAGILDILLEKDEFIESNRLSEIKIMLSGTINRILNKMNKSMSDIFGEDAAVYLKFASCRNKDELSQSVSDIFERLCENNERNVNSKQEKMSKEIVGFIESNFADPEISLDKVARAFYISQNHVSRVLKNSIGKSYKDYLNFVRIEEAKKLLINTPMTVGAVANSVGYDDVTAFIRIFKKYTHHTPNDFRLSTDK